MKQKHDFGPRERERSERSRTAPDEGNDLDKTTPTHTLDSNHDQFTTTNATLRTKKETICKMGRQVFVDYFSLIVRHKPKKLHKVDSSLEKVFPRVLGKCVLFLLRRTRTSSKVRCVLKRVNFARSERIAFLYFSTGRSLLFSREQIFEREYSSVTLSERVKHQIRPQYFIAQ